jgi:hypothetical protein
MRTSLFSLFLLVAACGGRTFQSGLGVTFNDYTEHGSSIGIPEANQLDNWLIDELALYGYEPGFIKGLLKFATVSIQEDDFKCHASPGPCAGENYGSMMQVVNKPCAWQTAYRHEMTHYFQGERGVVDMKHERPEWRFMNWYNSDCSPSSHTESP